MKRIVLLFLSLVLICCLIFPLKNSIAASSWYNGFNISVTIGTGGKSSSHSISGKYPGGYGTVYYTQDGTFHLRNVNGTGSTSTWSGYFSIKYGNIYRASTTLKQNGNSVYTVTEIND